MKKIFFIAFMLPFFCKAQHLSENGDTLYTSSGFKVFIGQELKIGAGSMPNGNFKYVRVSTWSWGASASQDDNNLPKGASHSEYEVLKIAKRGNKKHGFVYYPILAGMIHYEVDIDNAISTGEIEVPEEFRPKPETVVVQINQNISVADELLKLKKLRDDGVLTEDEYQAQKKKLLEK